MRFLTAVIAVIAATLIDVGTMAPIAHARSDAAASSALGPFRTLTISGRTTRFGLTGSYREIDDLASGWFRSSADYGISSADEGFDASGRWRMDASRRLHALDSDEARAVAVTESYLVRRAYLRDSMDSVATASPSKRLPGGFDVVTVTPPGGRTVRLWTARGDRRVYRIDVRLDERVKTIRYGDYRVVSGVALPFVIAIDDGDEPDTNRVVVSSYHLARDSNFADFVPPPERRSDTRLDGSSVARVSMRSDRSTMGFAVVDVAIDGQGPLPFIVDTGGHDIVTSAAARRLRLTVAGVGATFGAGAGSTKTGFTRVKTVSLGDAALTDQPFVVLYQDLGSAQNTRGRDVPIAGILGLELFERFVVTLDFRTGVLELRPRSATSGATKAWLRVRFTSDEPLVNARVDGVRGSFAIDTGDNVGLILHRRWIAAVRLSGLTYLRDRMNGDAVGGAVSFRRARIGSLALGTVRRSNVPVLVSDARSGSLSRLSEAGSIGVSNLSQSRVTFDYAAGRMLIDR